MTNNYNLKEIDKTKILCIDTETTGLSCETDEILQISIIDGNNKILFNQYIKPKHKKSWKEAERIHGISPDKVKDLPTIDTYRQELNTIFKNAEIVIGYNLLEFDDCFLEAAGIKIPNNILCYDVMLEFAPVYGEWNDYFQEYKWQKLSTCARYYKYDWGNDAAHDSLADAKATLFCFYKMNDML